MKNKKIIIGIVVAIVIVIAVAVAAFVATGKDNDSLSSNAEQASKSEEKINGNYNVFEAIQKLEPTDTLEVMNEKMGFEAKDITSEGSNGWKKYEWEITEDTSLQATIFETSKTASFTAEFPDEMIANDKADFSNVKDFKSKINSTEGLKYEDFVNTIGCEGTVEKRDSNSIGYTWVNSDKGVLHASFYLESGKCSIYNGVF